MKDLHVIVSSDAFLKGADFHLCTGPYFLCHMLQLILDVTLLVYMGASVYSPYSARYLVQFLDISVHLQRISVVPADHRIIIRSTDLQMSSGLTLTYMAPSYAVEDILKSARGLASDFGWTGSQGLAVWSKTSQWDSKHCYLMLFACCSFGRSWMCYQS